MQRDNSGENRTGNNWTGARWRAPQDDVRGRILTFRTQAVRVEPTEEEEVTDKTLPNVNPRPLVTVDGEPVEGVEGETEPGVEWGPLPPFDPDTEREQQPYDRMHVSDEIDISEARRRWERLQYGLE